MKILLKSWRDTKRKIRTIEKPFLKTLKTNLNVKNTLSELKNEQIHKKIKMTNNNN